MMRLILAFEAPGMFVKHSKELEDFKFDQMKTVANSMNLSSSNREEWASAAPFEPEDLIRRKRWMTKDEDYDTSYKDVNRRLGGFLGVQSMLKRNPMHFLANEKSSFFTYKYLSDITKEQLLAFEGKDATEAPVSKKVKISIRTPKAETSACVSRLTHVAHILLASRDYTFFVPLTFCLPTSGVHPSIYPPHRLVAFPDQ